jgi:hypothetical protein
MTVAKAFLVKLVERMPRVYTVVSKAKGGYYRLNSVFLCFAGRIILCCVSRVLSMPVLSLWFSAAQSAANACLIQS